MSTSLLSLLQLTDPALPIGGFSHSAGLETYVQKGAVHNVVTAKAFITSMLSQNLHHTDGIFVSLAYEAALNNNLPALFELDSECLALKMPVEIRTASQKLGIRLLKIFSTLLQHPTVATVEQAVKQQHTPGNYCVLFGLIAASLQLTKTETLTGFYYNAASAMVTNCVKLIPLGQQDGQQILFSLQALLYQLAESNLNPDLERLGMCCTGFDIASMQHEQLYSRLYMS